MNDHENHDFLVSECPICWEEIDREAARWRPHPSVLENERFYRENEDSE